MCTILAHAAIAPQSATHTENTAPAAPSTTTAPSAPAAPKLLILPQTPATAQTIEKVNSLQEQGDRLFARQEFGPALSKWQEAYGTSIEIGYFDGQGRALTGMCQLYTAKGQVIKAKELGENAIEVLSNSTDKLSLGKARVALAQAYFALDNPSLAAQQLEMALKIFSQLGNQDAGNTARVMQLVGSVLVKQDKVKAAIPFFQGAATFYGQAGNSHEEMSIRTSLVALMEQLGLYVASLEEAQRAVAAARATRSPVYISDALLLLGSAQYDLCEFAFARKSFEEALSVQPEGVQKANRANLYTGYGCALAVTGDTEKALQFLQQAYPVVKEKAPATAQAQLLNTLGVVEELLNQHSAASRSLEQALELQAIATPKRDRLHIVILQNLAAVEFRDGLSRLAVSHLQSALSVARSSKYNLLEGRICTSLAQVLFGQKDFAGADQYLHQGIEISESLNDDAALWQDYTLSAQIQAAEHTQQSSVNESLKSALSYFRSPQAGLFSSAEELGYAVPRVDMAHRLIAQLIASGMTESAYLTATQLKEEAFVNEWSKRGGTVKPEDAETYTDLVSDREHLHAAEAGSTPNQMLSSWKSWIQRFQQLAGENRSLARLIAPVPLNYETIRKCVVGGSLTLIDYSIGSAESFVFTIDPHGSITSKPLPIGTKSLEPQISGLINSTLDQESSSKTKQILQLLYAELFPPEVLSVLPARPDAVVTIVPDDALFNLPFAALITPQGKFLVQDHALTLVPSAEALADSAARYSTSLSILVATAATPSNDGSKQRLPAEANVISDLFEANTSVHLFDANNGVDSLSDQARGKAILHFPNRLVLLPSNPFHSVLSVASGSQSQAPITANSLFDLNLPNDLAVLSKTSINTADVQGQSVRVFSSGFRYAGIRNLLMSLWVEPESQRIDEIVEFYRGNQQGLNQAQSLRQAQLVAMSKDPSIRSWAALQLIGPGN